MRTRKFYVATFLIAIAGAFHGSVYARKTFAFGPYCYTDAAGAHQSINSSKSCEGSAAACTITTPGGTVRLLFKNGCTGTIARFLP